MSLTGVSVRVLFVLVLCTNSAIRTTIARNEPTDSYKIPYGMLVERDLESGAHSYVAES